MNTSLIKTYTGADESLFQGISTFKEPICEYFIDKGRLFLLNN
jgi:hypothetical protein